MTTSTAVGGSGLRGAHATAKVIRKQIQRLTRIKCCLA
jgi:hypothetical protein